MTKNKLTSFTWLRRFGQGFAALLFTAATVIASQNITPHNANAATVYDKEIYAAVRDNRDTLLTQWESEASGAVERYGFSSYRHQFYASSSQASGLSPVWRLYNNRTYSFMFTASAAERDNAVNSKGYAVEHVSFYAATTKSSENEPVYRYVKGNYYRYAMTPTDRTILTNQGYTQEGVVFYARPVQPIQPAPSPSVYTKDFYYAIRDNHSSLITAWESEARGAVERYGFTSYKKLFYAAESPTDNLSPVWRLHNSRTNNFMYTSSLSERTNAINNLGYKLQAESTFYAATAKADGNEPVYRYVKGNYHRYALTTADRAALSSQGYTQDAIAFYAKPAEETTGQAAPQDADGKFSIAIMPDTQLETMSNNQRFLNRINWLINNRDNLDLRFVGHIGDVTNWGWLDPIQFTNASNGAALLENADLPYAFAIGNHDSRAVGHDGIPGSRGYGGSAYVDSPECVERLGRAACDTGLLQHDTREFNAVFNASRFSVAGAYEVNKVDNIYSIFEAAGKKWLMLTLEMNPREAVVAWARTVAQNHPNHNILIQTHQYLARENGISQDNGYGDGSRSGQYLFDNLVKLYPNIVAVFSGHQGQSYVRTDTGVNGNKITSHLQAIHSSSTNPVRLIEFDVNNNSLTTWVYAPLTNQTIETPSTHTGLSIR